MGMDNITPPIGCGSVAFRMPTIQDIYCSDLERDVANLLANLCDANKEAEKLKDERDRLRDIVRRLCDELESHYYEPESLDDPSIVREARAAIGEDKP